MISYAEIAIDTDLFLCAKLVEKYSETLIDDLELIKSKATKAEDDASVILSTTHRIKGRDWNSVALADDFLYSLPDDAPDEKIDEELRILYVAITRAREKLQIPEDILHWLKSKPKH